MPTPEEIAKALETLDAAGTYRVLKAAHVPTAQAESFDVARAIALDVETTGFDPRSEKIIELGIVPFTYDRQSGAILEVGEHVQYFEDPGKPIPPEIVELTGLTDDDVRGKSIDEDRVKQVFDEADLVIAHNAGFDRPFVDQRLPFVQGKAWADSFSEIPWKAHGQECMKLGCLLKNHAGMFFTGHRAATDAEAILSLLATPFEDGTSPMLLLLESARLPSMRVAAYGSPFETKDILKARGYRWNAGDKVWWIDVPEAALDDELAWLKDEVYGGRDDGPQVLRFNAMTRYTTPR